MEWKIKILACCMIGLAAFLPIVIAAKYDRKHQHLHWCEDGYVMRQSKFFLVLSIICTIGHFAFVVMCIAILGEYIIGEICGMLVFLVGLIMGVGLSIYALLWRCVVKADSMTFYCPFLPVKVIKFYEITKVEYAENRTAGYGGGRKFLKVYCKKKKVFEFYDDMIGFDRLYYQLYQLGKIMKNELKDEFCLRYKKGDIARAVFALVFFGGILIAGFWALIEGGGLDPIYMLLSLCLALYSLIDLIGKLRWKVTVSYGTIQIRNSFGGIEKYSIREITEAHEEKHHIILYTINAEIGKISKDCENCLLLQERLTYEGIIMRSQ